MTPSDPDAHPLVSALDGAVTAPAAANAVPVEIDADAAEPPKMRAGLIFVLVFLTFGASMAVVVPLAFSLTVKLDVLVPGRVDVLGVVTAIGAVASIICTPLVGVLSDRTRSRLGRRRPWVIGGAVTGTLGLIGLALAPSVPVLTIAWVVTLVSWQISTNMVISLMGDRLPESQRGRVGAINGLANNVAPIIGVALVSSFARDLLPLFLVPGVFALIGVVLFAVVAKDVTPTAAAEVESQNILRRMVFNPRAVPDFAWNWLGRFALFLGIAFTSTYGTYFFAARLNMDVAEVGGLIAISGIGGVLFGMLGALGAGFLSDKLGRRKIFVIISGVIMLAGGIVSAVSYDLTGLIVGSVLANLAIGSFSAVDQAIVLDVVPSRAESGRYIALMQVAQQIPTALGPLVAIGILAIGGGGPNYTLLYIVFGALALVGSLIIVLKVRGVR
jgi:MFS family permease